jgi:glycosyltransferase involved in cell wall biosynthesis
MAKVSIVIPTFNQASYLQACLDHCWFQTHPDLELVVVDGGSTDATKDLLAGWRERLDSEQTAAVVHMDADGNVVRKALRRYREDTHATHPAREIKILSFPKDIGKTATYNAGFRAASGDYCTYVVGDDLPHPHMIEELAAELERSGADLVYSDFQVVDDDGRILRQVRKPDYGFRECFAEWFHLGVSTLHRRSLHERFGLMDERLRMANDYEWYLRMAMGGARIQRLPRVLYSVRWHGHGPSLDEESRQVAAKARAFLAGPPRPTP